MRITNSMMVSRMMTNMNSNLRSMDKWNNDLASGVTLHRPSDDPVLVARSLKIHTDIAETEQFTRNVDDAYSWLDKTETSLKELTNVMQRVRELTVQASNGTLTPEDSQKIQSEVKQLKDHMVKIGNDTYVGRHIFSGFSTDKAFLDDSGTISADFIDPATGGIKTEGQKIEYQVGVSAKTKVNVTGDQLFGPVDAKRLKYEPDAAGDYYWNENIILMGNYDMEVNKLDKDGNPVVPAATETIHVKGTMDKIIESMESGDSKAISNLLKDIDIHMDNISKLRGDVGARMNTVEVIKDRAQTMTLNFSKLLSETEDTDMGEATMNLSMREAVYNASLAVGAKIIQPTLVDFLG